jgi:hypothetical protein
VFKILKQTFAILFLIVSISACDKKTPPPVVETPPPVVVDSQPSIYTCEKLPPAPNIFGWRDSTTDANKNINTFMFNPANPNEMLLVVNGDITGFNKMYYYHIPTKTSRYIAAASHFPPSVNKFGWVVFSTLANDIYKIKINGDSLTQLTFGYNTKDVKWDVSQKHIYYFQAAFNSVPTQILKATDKGFTLTNLKADLPNFAMFNKSEQIIFQKINGTQVTLIQRNMVTQEERNLITGPYDSKAELSHFDNITLDNEDKNFYWSNALGVFKCELSTLITDTLFKNCETVKFENPIFQQVKPNEMLFTCKTTKAINKFQLLHSHKALVYNTLSKSLTEIKVFP